MLLDLLLASAFISVATTVVSVLLGRTPRPRAPKRGSGDACLGSRCLGVVPIDLVDKERAH